MGGGASDVAGGAIRMLGGAIENCSKPQPAVSTAFVVLAEGNPEPSLRLAPAREVNRALPEALAVAPKARWGTSQAIAQPARPLVQSARSPLITSTHASSCSGSDRCEIARPSRGHA